MSVTVTDQDGRRAVAVLGALESAPECRALLAACEEAVGPCEVSFYDAWTLPGEVIEQLARLLRAGRALKLVAYEGFLAYALTRLGLAVTHVPSRSRRAEPPRLAALAIGGSADSLSRILHIVENLPLGEVAVFVAQHVPEGQPNLLDQLLRVRTEYEVLMPIHLTAVRPRTLYVAPPGHHMKVANGFVYLTRDRKVQFARPSLDVLFESVAAEYGERAMATLLCGFGRDGVDGCAAVRRRGGVALAEEAAECEAAGALPQAARAAGACDLTLELPALTCHLASAVGGRSREPDAHLIALLLKALHARYGYDFRGYAAGTLERRLTRLMGALGERDFFELQATLLSDPAAFERFVQEMSINVTGLFRHPEQFRLLREEVLPYLDSFPLIKIWSAGCATGEEAYSLAILLAELGMLEKSYLFATDMNPHVLRLAATGLIPRDSLARSHEDYRLSGGRGRLDDFLVDTGAPFLKLAEPLRKRILFHHHSLTHDGVFNEFQLILCRNVLIYFTPQLQQRVLERFASSLHRDGFLVLGPKESLPGGGDHFFTDHRGGLHTYRWK